MAESPVLTWVVTGSTPVRGAMGEEMTGLTDSLGYEWTYYHDQGLLKLDTDDTENGGYLFDSLEEAEDFLKECY